MEQSIRKTDKIILTYYVNPHHFYFKYKTDEDGEKKVSEVNDKIEAYVSRHIEKRPSKPHSPDIGEIVLCYYISDCVYKWMRARVDFKLQYDKEMFILWAIDYGFPIETDAQLIRPLLSEELKVAVKGLIFKGGLFDIVPATLEYNFMNSAEELSKTKKWSPKAVETVEKYLNQAHDLTFKCRAYFENHFFGSLIIESKLIVEEFLKSSKEAVESENFLKEYSRLEEQPYWQRQGQDAIFKIYENNSDITALTDATESWMTTDDLLKKADILTDLPKLVELDTQNSAAADEELIELRAQPLNASTNISQSYQTSLYSVKTSRASNVYQPQEQPLEQPQDASLNEIPMKSRLAVAQQKIVERGKTTARKNAKWAELDKRMMAMSFPAGFIVDNNALENKHRRDDSATMRVELPKKKNTSYFEKEIEECVLVSPPDRILVHSHGRIPYKRTNDIRDINFPQQIHDALRDMNIQQVFRIQTIGWPELIKGYSMIFVNNARTGKTWTYLPAILALLIQRIEDNDIVDNCGPLAIITCASSQEVNETIHRVMHFLRFSPGIRCHKAFGFTDEGSVVSHLLNGTEIFVTTIPCLHRLMANELNLFTKERIISLVFDNIDLAYERFGQQIHEIQKSFCAPGSNVQMIITSRTWHKVLTKFYLESPQVTLCIGSYIEAAVYGRTKMSIELLGQEQKIDKLIAHINDINYRFELTIVICNTTADVEELVQKLRALSIEFWYCHDATDSFEIDEVKNQIVHSKSELFKLLVCTDEVLRDIDIRCAKHIIHFSLPLTWTMFGFRFSTLLNHHQNLTEKKDDEKVATSVVFLDECNNNELPRLVDFMRMRGNCSIPEEVLRLAETIRLASVSNIFQPFCNDFITIGICYGRFTCRDRHILTAADRSTEIPQNGYVKFDIVTVRSPVHFTVRLLAHRISSDDKWTQLHSTDDFFSFNMEMQKYFEDEDNQAIHFPFALGDLCAVSVRSSGLKIYERGKIVKIEEKNFLTVITQYFVEILLIDHNSRISRKSTELMVLPDHFKSFPQQAVDVRIAEIVPRDFDNEWDASVLDLVKQWVGSNSQHYCQGHIKLSVMNTLWLDSIDLTEILQSIKEEVKIVSIKKNLLRRNVCVRDSKPLDLLTTLARNAGILAAHDEDTETAITTPREIDDRTATTDLTVFNKSDDNFDVDESDPSVLNWSTSSSDDDAHDEELLRSSQDNWAELTLDQFNEVFLCNFYHPNRLYIRNGCYSTRFVELIHQINEFSGCYENLIPLSNIALAANCLAEFGNGYARAKVIKIFYQADGIIAEVFYVDFGQFLVLPAEELMEVPEKFVTILPFQAIFCQLIGIRPMGSPKWSETICDTIFEQLLQSRLYARSMKLGVADKYAYGLKARSHQVVLFDETGHTNINSWIVSSRHGEWDPNTKRFVNRIAFEPLLDTEISDRPDYAEGDDEMLIDEDDDNCFDVQIDEDELPLMLQGMGITLPKRNEPLPAEIEEIHDSEPRNVVNESLAQSNSPAESVSYQAASGKIELLCPHKMPKIKWHQTESIVVVAVHAPDVDDYHLEVTPRMLKICFSQQEEKFAAILNLFGCIDSKYTVHGIRGLNIVVRLAKTMNRLFWPRLVQANEKCHFIEYNFEADKFEESQVGERPSADPFCRQNESYSSSDEEADADD